MPLLRTLHKLLESGPLLRDAVATGNFRVLASMLGPAYRGFIQQRGKGAKSAEVSLGCEAHFDWSYRRDHPEIRRLYEAANASQWNVAQIDWTREVDPYSPEQQLIPDRFLPVSEIPSYQRLSQREKARRRHCLLSWLLSQFLHGEQGALFAAAQGTAAVPWMDAKLFCSSQVADEGRHIEVFYLYLTRKLEKLYEINDNLYVIIDTLMTDSRWDIQFLGMQILVEGLALGAFGMIHQVTDEPLLKEVLKHVITDEARHVHFGVLALQDYYQKELSERERRDREEWAFEISLLLRNRFLAHEFYDEFYAHEMTRAEWNRILLNSKIMAFFRTTMFKRIIPNLKRLGLVGERVRPRYRELGLLNFENGKAAPELSAAELLGDF